MHQSAALNRRGFIGMGLSAMALASFEGATSQASAAEPDTGDPWLGLKIGIASYTFNRFKLDETIKAIQRVGVSYVSIKENHLKLKSTTEERKAVVKQFQDAGITPLSCGVVSLKGSESDIRNAFEYTRDCGLPTMVCSPTREVLPLLDKLVKEFDIKLAIHNHGPEDKVWPSPYDVWEGVQKYDDRIGLCIDVGHTARAGVNPVEAIRKCAPRLYDLHLKDITSTQRGSATEVGRGVLDVAGMLRALLEIKYAHHAGLEYEKDLRDPLPGVAESIGYIRGTLAGFKRG